MKFRLSSVLVLVIMIMLLSPLSAMAQTCRFDQAPIFPSERIITLTAGQRIFATGGNRVFLVPATAPSPPDPELGILADQNGMLVTQTGSWRIYQNRGYDPDPDDVAQWRLLWEGTVNAADVSLIRLDCNVNWTDDQCDIFNRAFDNTWADGGGIYVCNPINPTPTPTRTRTPTPTRTPAPARPAGCVEYSWQANTDLEMMMPYDATIWAWGHVNANFKYWRQYGGYSDAWVDLDYYQQGTGIDVQGGLLQKFRYTTSDGSPAGTMLVCRELGTPTPTSTTSCPNFRMTQEGDWGEYLFSWILQDEVQFSFESIEDDWEYTSAATLPQGAVSWGATGHMEYANYGYSAYLDQDLFLGGHIYQDEDETSWHRFIGDPSFLTDPTFILGPHGPGNSYQGYFCLYAIFDLSASPTPTPAPTAPTAPTALPSRTIPPANTQAATQTSWPTFTPTRTPTITPTPTIATQGCVGHEYVVPVSPGTLELTLTVGLKFVVADADMYINVGTEAVKLAPGGYQWGNYGDGSYTMYSLTTPVRLYVCITDGPTATPTTIATTGGSMCDTCVSISPDTPEIANLGPMPDMAIAVPTLRLLPTITATVEISITAIIGAIETIEAQIRTPVAAIETASAGYSWQAGEEQGAEWAGWMSTGLEWLAIINPQNPAWESDGGPLWAIYPAIWPILPIVVVMAIVSSIVFLIVFFSWLITLFDIIVKIIELIPGE